MAKAIHVPAAIITHVNNFQIEILKANRNNESQYQEGFTVDMANHYCEKVIKTKSPLHVHYAPAQKEWMNAPELKHEMVSYLGYPLTWPDGEIFGTICVLDHKENHYSENYKSLMVQFKNLAEAHLALIVKNSVIANKYYELENAISEIKQLRGIIPICSHCKNIRNDQGYWVKVEEYVTKHSDALFSHGICPSCMERLYSDASQH